MIPKPTSNNEARMMNKARNKVKNKKQRIQWNQQIKVAEKHNQKFTLKNGLITQQNMV